jgi:hypothetical protein
LPGGNVGNGHCNGQALQYGLYLTQCVLLPGSWQMVCGNLCSEFAFRVSFQVH